MHLPPPLTPAQAAEALGCTERWLREQASARRVPHFRPHSKLLLFTVEDVAAIRELWAQPAETEPESLTTRRSRSRGRVA
jgi:hypothetical protein